MGALGMVEGSVEYFAGVRGSVNSRNDNRKGKIMVMSCTVEIDKKPEEK